MKEVKKNVSNEGVLTFTKLANIAAKYPKRPAIIYLGEKYSFSELDGLSDKFANALSELGIGKGDVVMIFIPNCIQWLIAYFGIQKVGGVPTPISPTYTSYEIGYIAKDSEAKAIICQDANFVYIKGLTGTVIKKVILVNIADILPLWKRVAGYLTDSVPRGRVELEEDTYLFRKLLKKQFPKSPRVEINAEEDFAYILYTGGTLGFPKGVAGTYKGMAVAIDEITNVIRGYANPEKDVFLLVTPLFHILGQALFIGFGIDFGCTTVLLPQANVDALLYSIEKHKVSIFIGVPALYRMILENDRLDFYDLSSLRICFSGGDVLPKATYDDWHEKTGIRIRQAYGSTETLTLALGTFDREYGADSVGRMMPGRQYKIVDSDTLEEKAEGEVGELMVYSEHMRKSYLNKPEETAHSFMELEGKTWYRTGDQVRRKGDELFFVDRGADIIKYKAYRVSASEIETALKDHPSVMEACVTGVPDAKTGERIKGIVVLKEDVKGVSAIELIRWCKERLAPYKIPSYIEFRDMLPKSKVGKLLRREVRDEERRRASE